MITQTDGENLSFQRLCVLLALSISLIFSIRYGMMIASGVKDAIFAHDFEVFYRAARLFSEDSHYIPYDHAKNLEELKSPHYHPFLNPPFLLFLLSPLGYLPYGVALTVYLCTQLALWIAALASAPVRALWPYLASQRRYLLTAVTISLPFLTNTVLTGQLGIFYAAVLLYGLSLVAVRPALAGIVLSLICCKPTLGLLVPVYLLAARQWKTLFVFSGMAVLFAASATMLWGMVIWQDWLSAAGLHVQMLKLEQIPEKFQIQLVSVYSGLRLIGMPASPALLLQSILAVAGAALLFAVTLKTPYDRRIVPLLFVGAFVVTGYSLQYDTVLVSAALLYLLDINAHRPLLSLSRIGLLLGISFSLVTLQLQAMHIPFGALTLLWLTACIWLQEAE